MSGVWCLVDAVHVGVAAGGQQRAGDLLLLVAALAQVDQSVQHPQRVVVTADVEAALVEHIDSRVVTVESEIIINNLCSRREIRKE